MKTPSITKSALALVGGTAILAGNLGAAQSFNKSRTFSTGGDRFSASASVQAFDNYTPGVDYSFTGRADASAKVFGTTKEVAKAEATGSVNYLTKQGRAKGFLRAFGVSLVNFDKSFASTGTFRTPTFSRSLTIAEAHFTVGPVPMSVKAGGSLSIFGEVNYNITQSASSPYPTVQIKARTPFDVAATASASVDIFVAEAGIRGSLSLLGSELAADVKVAPGLLGSVFADDKFEWITKSMGGNLELFATVGIEPFAHTFTHTIASFTGLTNKVLLHQGRVTLKPITILADQISNLPVLTAAK